MSERSGPTAAEKTEGVVRCMVSAGNFSNR